jgi:hypothetical protein
MHEARATIAHTGERRSRHRPFPILMKWVGITLLGFPLGGLLAHAIAGPVDSMESALLGGAIAGFIIGTAQWFVLRRELDIDAIWIVMTVLGLACGLAVGGIAVGFGTSAGELAGMGAVTGTGVGIAQGLVMRGYLDTWGAWMAAGPALWTTGWLVTWAARIQVDEQFTNFGAAGALVFGILSGALLSRGIRLQDARK